MVQWSIAQKFYVQVAATTLPMGQSMEIMFTAENINSADFQMPVLNDFTIVGGPNISQNTSIINTSISESRSWSYYIQPKHTGICKILPATLNTKKGKLFTQSVDINVTGANSQNNTTTNSATNPTTKNSTSNASTNKHFLFRVSANKNSLFVGEDLVLTYKLYVDEYFEAATILEDLKNANLTVIKVYNEKSDQLTQLENFEGKRYESIILQKIHVSSTKVGKFTLAPIKLNISVKRKDANFIEKITGTDVEDILIQSNLLNLEVKELPNPIPANFNNAIGNYSISCSLNKPSANTDEPLTYKLTIAGTGNMNNIVAPKLVLPDYFEKYDPTLTENLSLKNNEFSGTITFDYIITPHEPGTFKLSPAQFSFYNITTHQYENLMCDSLPITITGKATPYNKTIANPVLKDSNQFVINHDFGAHISNKINWFGTWYYYLILVFPLLLLSFMAGLQIYKKTKVVDKGISKQDFLQKINHLKTNTDYKEVCKSSNQLLKEILLQKFPKANLSSQFTIIQALQANGVNEVLKNKILILFENNEKNIYAPFVSSDASTESLIKLKEITEELLS